ncbi:hypothetical protein KK062_20945 [Fulvivirgaceae bacterium PWU5]|uniref:Uncharacterized protein n=1 Tax=Dawidia cretensis TaxID=2782350 RepID=A0AAP2E0D5_9BACT|nr:DUF6157 family protein [Dawidia cretensis]MBT1710721.1 hypothetical protein [Dawidia cretensis]
MKTHTTNYFDTFIEVAEDTKASSGTKPPSKGDAKTVAEMQYALVARSPYKYTSDDVLFRVYAERNDIPKDEHKIAREQFFSKGQACLRASPLTKTYGFGVHSNSEGKIALYGMETPEYEKLTKDTKVKKVKAMKSAR